MKNRVGPFLPLVLLLVLALSLVGCEKERPAPPAQTPAAGGQSGTRAPQANVTTVVLPTQTTGARTVGATPQASDEAQGSAVPTPQPLGVSASTTAPQASGSGAYFTYTVVSGDTLAKIASKFNVTPESIVTLNALANPDIVTTGQELKIPGQAAAETSGGSTSPSTYTVKPGETLYSVASRFGLTVQDLIQANNISNPDQLYSGQVLKIPGGKASAGASDGKTYTVQRGDTLYKIAVKYGVTTADLQAANDLTNPNQIYAGQVLKIP